MTILTCPKCHKDAHTVCGRSDCVCLTSIPSGELPLSHHWQLGPITALYWIGNVAWKAWWKLGLGNLKHPHHFMLELERCPYCGYTNSMDFWFERSLHAYEKGSYQEEA